MNGALDEWLSHRSAKPSTAVRIRQAPHFRKISTTPADIFLFYSQQVFRLSGRLGTPTLDGVLDGVLAGVLLKHGFGRVGQISLRGEVRSCGVLPSRQILMCLGLSGHISTSFRCTPVTHGSAFQAPERYV